MTTENTAYRPLICVDADIPWLDDRLDSHARVRRLSQDEFTATSVRDADALMIRTRTRCGAPLLQGSSVKCIATATIGMDQFDLPWCERAGIQVSNAPGCNAPAVAQYVWSAILHSGYKAEGLRLGIVGCGHVGSIVAEWGKRLGARVMVSDPPLQQAGERTDINFMPLQQLAAQCDVLTVHTPYTRTGAHPTHHLIDASVIASMPRGSLFINAARGPVSDNAALLPALRSNHIKAAIDCWEGEPRIDLEVLRLAQIATFHIAGYSRQGKQRATRMALDAIARFFHFTADLSGLEGDYVSPAVIDEEKIINSFDPAPVTDLLRTHPDRFDSLRAAYELRDELR